MNRYVCYYGMRFKNPFDNRRLILLIRALNKDDALRIAMNKVQDSSENAWNICQIIETESNVDAVIVVGD
jgi:6-phosphogluconate dehydrogenase (decarboxylating)